MFNTLMEIQKGIEKFFSNPKVLDGSVIFVGTKEEEEPFDSTEFLKEVASIASGFAQALALLIVSRN